MPDNIVSINAMTENILQSLNNNDYPGFSRDFSDTLKNTLTAHVFLNLKSLISQTSGDYISKSTPKLYSIEGVEVYDYACEFQNESVFVSVSIGPDSGIVEGLLFDSAGLRSATGQ